jgi:hypothetical protein
MSFSMESVAPSDLSVCDTSLVRTAYKGSAWYQVEQIEPCWNRGAGGASAVEPDDVLMERINKLEQALVISSLARSSQRLQPSTTPP